MSENHVLFSNKNKKLIGKFKIKTPENFCIHQTFCLRSKMYAFKCGNDSKDKLKGFRKGQSKNINFIEYKRCLDGEEYQKECDNFIVRSLNHEICLQLQKTSTLSPFDDTSCYESTIKSKPWNWKL